jgi:teichuronic acid biosynthesis glycosyltransferase TuaG
MVLIDNPLDFFSFAALAIYPLGTRLDVVNSNEPQNCIGYPNVVSTDEYISWVQRLCALSKEAKARGLLSGVNNLEKPDVLILNGVFDSLPKSVLHEILSNPERFANRQIVVWKPMFKRSSNIESLYFDDWAVKYESLSDSIDDRFDWDSFDAQWDRVGLVLQRNKADSVDAEFAFCSILAPRDFRYSVIVPHYNHWDVVGEAIRSVESAANGTRCEIVFVDDASTRVGTVPQATIPMKRVFLKENGGVSAALNAGIEVSDGDFICWLSADDLYLDNFFKVRNLILRHRSDLDLVYGDSFATQVGTNRYTRTRRYPEDCSFVRLLADLSFNNGVSGITWTIARESLGDSRFDVGNRHAQDAKMWFALAQKGLRSASVPVPTAITRFFGTNYSQRYPDICSIEAVLGVLSLASNGNAPEMSSGERTEYTKRLAFNLVKALAMSGWDYPKGFAAIRSLTALLVTKQLFPTEWTKIYSTVLKFLEQGGVPPERLLMVHRWGRELRDGRAGRNLIESIQNRCLVENDVRPDAELEFGALKHRHTNYFY